MIPYPAVAGCVREQTVTSQRKTLATLRDGDGNRQTIKREEISLF